MIFLEVKTFKKQVLYLINTFLTLKLNLLNLIKFKHSQNLRLKWTQFNSKMQLLLKISFLYILMN